MPLCAENGVGNLSPAMGRGIGSRNRVWNWVAKLHRLAGRYDNMPNWFIAPIAGLKLLTLCTLYQLSHIHSYNPSPTSHSSSKFYQLINTHSQTMITVVSFSVNYLAFWDEEKTCLCGGNQRFPYGKYTDILKNTKMIKRTLMLLENILSKYHMNRNQFRFSMYICIRKKKYFKPKTWQKIFFRYGNYKSKKFL